MRKQNGKIRIKKVYNGESWNPGIKAPLAINGINIKEGDYILSVDGKKSRCQYEPFSNCLSKQQADKLPWESVVLQRVS